MVRIINFKKYKA